MPLHAYHTANKKVNVVNSVIMDYHISRNIGEHYIWRFAQKMLLLRFKLADFSSVWRETHACSIRK